MLNRIFISENKNEVNEVLNLYKNSSDIIVFIVPNLYITRDLKIDHNKIQFNEFIIDKEKKEELEFLSFNYMKELSITNDTIDNFISDYKFFYPLFKNEHIIKTLREDHNASHFQIKDNPINRLLRENLLQEGIDLELLPLKTTFGQKFNISDLSLKKIIDMNLRKIQHKTNIYPSIMFNKDFYKKKRYSFVNNKEKNVLINASFHINFARALLPYEKMLLEKGYNIYYLAKTIRVANFLLKNSNQDVISIQELMNWDEIGNKNFMLDFPTQNKSSKPYFESYKSKLFEFEKYYNAIKILFEKNKFDLVMLADDIEPFGRYLVKQAKIKHIKTINVQHGFISDKFNYSSTISDIMLTWDEKSTDLIQNYKTSDTQIITVGPSHLNNINQNSVKDPDGIIISWFPSPDSLIGEQEKLKKLINDFIQTFQNSWESENVTFMIKLHPFDSLERYKKVIKQLSMNKRVGTEIYQNEVNPIDLIIKSDFVIAMNTSVAYEAHLLGTPVIAYNPYNEDLNPMLVPYYEKIITTKEDLTNFINVNIKPILKMPPLKMVSEDLDNNLFKELLEL